MHVVCSVACSMSVLMYLWMTGRRCVSSTLQASTAVTRERRAEETRVEEIREKEDGLLLSIE